jgi:hypothetical protein
MTMKKADVRPGVEYAVYDYGHSGSVSKLRFDDPIESGYEIAYSAGQPGRWVRKPGSPSLKGWRWNPAAEAWSPAARPARSIRCTWAEYQEILAERDRRTAYLTALRSTARRILLDLGIPAAAIRDISRVEIGSADLRINAELLLKAHAHAEQEVTG